MKVLLFLVTCFCIPFTWTVNHFKVTEDGRYIKAMPSSPYMMAQPGSLVDFIKQGEVVKEWEKAVANLKEKVDHIRELDKSDDPDWEKKLMETNPFCKKGKDVAIQLNTFLTSYAVEQTKDYVAQAQLDVIDGAFAQKKSGDVPASSIPRCPDIEFSMYTMDHLEGVADRLKLVIDKDSPLFTACAPFWELVSKEPLPSEEAFRDLLVRLLDDESSPPARPAVLLGAVCYWRSVGNAGEAVRCARAAVHYAHNSDHLNQAKLDYLPYAFFTMGNLLQLAKREDDAAVLLELAAHRSAYQGISALSHAALADAYAAAANLTASVSNYKEAIRLVQGITLEDVDVDAWATKEAALRCQMTIKETLEKQEKQFQFIIEDKGLYLHFADEASRTEKLVQERLTTDEARLLASYTYDFAVYGAHKDRSCIGRANSRKHQELLCTVSSAVEYAESMMALRQKTLRNRRTINESAEWKVAELWHRERSFDRNIAPFVGMVMDEPMIRPKYPLEDSPSSATFDRYWRRADWPNSNDCGRLLIEEDLFDSRAFPSIFISPENKGFIVADLLTKFLSLDFSDEHPLPWYEPDCGEAPYTTMEQRVIQDNLGVREALVADRAEVYAEQSLRSVFVRLAQKRLELMDVAQRIRTLIEKKIGPQWIALNLASLYFRISGDPRLAVKCALKAVADAPQYADIALSQIAQTVLIVSGSSDYASTVMRIAEETGSQEPLVHYLAARLHILSYRVDKGIGHLKETLDLEPSFDVARDDLLRLVCTGKTSSVGVRDQFPTVCCSSVVQNAVCFRFASLGERCYIVDESTQQLIYVRCNGVYTGACYKTHPFVNIVSPFLSIYSTGSRRDILSFHVDVGSVQTIESDELPLDYGGPSAFFVKQDPWWQRAKDTVIYERPREQERDEWSETVDYVQPAIPEKPLSFLWIKDKKEMLKYDISLPEVLPRPLPSQVRAGLQVFPPPRTASSMCSGVAKLSTLLETPVPTWVSVTAKGENLEKYIDIRSPVPSGAGLVPECPDIDEVSHSPILAFDHLPVSALSDQFLFYKPEKGLTEALKSLGNERESIEHVAARLHNAMKVSQMIPEMGAGQTGGVHWLLSLVSSLYWRVVGDAPKAVGCLRHSLQNAPPHMRDVALVSLSNVCHQAGLLHSALVASGAALAQSPNLAAIHVTTANIYASIGDYERALEFYYSTLSLQKNFEPAKDRIRAIYCHSGQTFNFHS